MNFKKPFFALAAVFMAAPFAHADVTVGVTVSATGPAASLGILEKNTIALMPQSIGGQKINYIVLDDASDTTQAVSNATATADPLKALDAALSKVDKLRGALGAVQNRFDSVISNLGTTINNLTSSRSRIEDADYATEVSNMSRAQILQQAGTSVLAQANQTTQGVMALLR